MGKTLSAMLLSAAVTSAWWAWGTQVGNRELVYPAMVLSLSLVWWVFCLIIDNWKE